MALYPTMIGTKLSPADAAKLAELLAASGLSPCALLRELVRRTTVAEVRKLKANKVVVMT